MIEHDIDEVFQADGERDNEQDLYRSGSAEDEINLEKNLAVKAVWQGGAPI